jgi:hypothetical protein
VTVPEVSVFGDHDPGLTALAELAATDPDTDDRAAGAFTGLTLGGSCVGRVAAGSRVKLLEVSAVT